jgi:DNA-binding transcriptional ArsR family regulator
MEVCMVVSQSVSQQEKLVELFKALGSVTRYEIFKHLMTGSQCNCGLSEILDIPLNLVSHHVHILLDLGLITARRDEHDARWIYYSVNQQELDAYRQAFLQLTDATGIKERTPAFPVKGCKKA